MGPIWYCPSYCDWVWLELSCGIKDFFLIVSLECIFNLVFCYGRRDGLGWGWVGGIYLSMYYHLLLSWEKESEASALHLRIPDDA